MRIAICAILCAVSLFAQTPRGVYTHERTTTGSSEKVTLHLPAASSDRTARLVAVSVYCVTACTAALTRDGTAPTATAATATKLNASSTTSTIVPAAAVIPYNASNVGAGTTIKNYNIAATEEKVIELEDKGLIPGENITITPSLSGARVFWMWREY